MGVTAAAADGPPPDAEGGIVSVGPCEVSPKAVLRDLVDNLLRMASSGLTFGRCAHVETSSDCVSEKSASDSDSAASFSLSAFRLAFLESFVLLDVEGLPSFVFFGGLFSPSIMPVNSL